MTEAAQRKPVAKPPGRLPVSAAVLWTGMALGTFLAVLALTHGVMLPGFGGFLDAILTFILILAAGVVLAEMTRRHHRTVARHAVRHGKRGTSAACRGARRHGGRGAAFVAGQAKSRWGGWRTRTEPEAPGRIDGPPLSEEWGVPPAPQSPNPTGEMTMGLIKQDDSDKKWDERVERIGRVAHGTGSKQRRTTATTAVPGAWGAVVAHTADFQAESDGDLLNWMRGEAIGAAAYAEAMVEQYETCLNVIGVDPVAIQTLHDVADAATTMAATMAAAVKKFAEHYELPTQFVADGGLLAHDGRWHKGDDG